MKRGSTPVTFVSSVAQTRKGTAQFLVLQSGGQGPLKLEYPDKASAMSARAQIMKSGNTYTVASMKLFGAISEALRAPPKQSRQALPEESD